MNHTSAFASLETYKDNSNVASEESKMLVSGLEGATNPLSDASNSFPDHNIMDRTAEELEVQLSELHYSIAQEKKDSQALKEKANSAEKTIKLLTLERDELERLLFAKDHQLSAATTEVAQLQGYITELKQNMRTQELRFTGEKESLMENSLSLEYEIETLKSRIQQMSMSKQSTENSAAKEEEADQFYLQQALNRKTEQLKEEQMRVRKMQFQITQLEKSNEELNLEIVELQKARAELNENRTSEFDTDDESITSGSLVNASSEDFADTFDIQGKSLADELGVLTFDTTDIESLRQELQNLGRENMRYVFLVESLQKQINLLYEENRNLQEAAEKSPITISKRSRKMRSVSTAITKSSEIPIHGKRSVTLSVQQTDPLDIHNTDPKTDNSEDEVSETSSIHFIGESLSKLHLRNRFPVVFKDSVASLNTLDITTVLFGVNDIKTIRESLLMRHLSNVD